MGDALDVLPEETREVVRLRLFEDLTMDEVARRTGLGVSGARHRFRRGFEECPRLLIGRLDPSDSAQDPAR